MDAASSGCAEVDTSRAFRSVKEAVAVFGERLIARETQERSSWPNAAAIVAAKLERGGGGRPPSLAARLERGDGGRPPGLAARLARGDGGRPPVLAAKLEKGGSGRPSGLLVRESLSKLNAIANAKPWRSGRKPASSLTPVRDAAPSSSLFVAPSPPPQGNNDDERCDRKETHLMVMNSIKKVEEEAVKTRQEVFQVRKRMAETELAMANLNAKLHHALSKMAHMEANRAAAARASIQQQRDSGDMAVAALTVWTEPQPLRQPLRHLLNLGDRETDDEEVHGQSKMETTMMTTTLTKKRKVEKEKPIVPLVVPLIYGMLFSGKKRTKDKESLYMKELYGLLRLT